MVCIRLTSTGVVYQPHSYHIQFTSYKDNMHKTDSPAISSSEFGDFTGQPSVLPSISGLEVLVHITKFMYDTVMLEILLQWS